MPDVIKIEFGTEDQYAEEIGCEDVNSNDHYAYTTWEPRAHSCFEFTSCLSIEAGKTYQKIQHFLLEGGCVKGRCLCVAYPRKLVNEEHDLLVIHKHMVGECPLSEYR
ncbi:MAG: hypothetical protein ACXAEN_20250 [Candidatus Thorarchaeota archaeon]